MLRHQVNEQKETISKITKSNENYQGILKKYKKENQKLLKIVKYVVDEGIGELGIKDYQGDALLCIKSMFDQIKTTIIDTQTALIKEKEHVKKLKTQNFELRVENYANFNLVLKMNEKSPNLQTGCKGFDQAIRAFDDKKGHVKRHYKTNSFSSIKHESEKDDWLESFSALKSFKN